MSLNAQSESRKPGAQLPSSNSPSFDSIVPGVSQQLAFTGTSARSAALQSTTTVVELVATAACFVAFGGATPTALADGTSMYLPANVVRRVGVTPGAKLAAIQATGAGTLYVTEGA